MASTARVLIEDIDRRIRHIEAQVRLGAEKEEIVKEQSDALLSTFSGANINLEAEIAVNDHLAQCSMWSASQLAAFGACLRLSARNPKLPKCGPRSVQRNPYLEHFLLQSDWDHLTGPANNNVMRMAEIMATRMHKFGLVCPDPDTLKRASAIIQQCFSGRPTANDKRSWAWHIKTVVKKMDATAHWPFEYIVDYPRSPMELPLHILEHAYGPDRPVSPPEKLAGASLQHLVNTTPYKRSHSEISSASDPDLKDPAKVDALEQYRTPPARSHEGPFANFMGAMVQAFAQQMVPAVHGAREPYRTFTSRMALQDASPPNDPARITFGPFPSHPSKDTSIQSASPRASEDDHSVRSAIAEEDNDDDELENFENMGSL